MSQEFIIDGDHEEMVANWIAESVECGCHGDDCKECDGCGRIARCELTEEQLAEHDRIKESTERRCFGAISRAPNDAAYRPTAAEVERSELQGDRIAMFRAEY